MPGNEEWLLQASMDDFMESAISIVMLGEQGVFNVGRRELRYLLELATKCVYCDQVAGNGATLAQRIATAGDRSQIPRSSVDVLDRITLRMVRDPVAFQSSVRSAFGALSGYTHVSKHQLDERVRRAQHGEFSGYESARTLEAFNRLVEQTYDLVLVLIFEGIGPAFTGDLFIGVFDEQPAWAFHRSRYVKGVSSQFDHKLERKNRHQLDAPK